MPAPKILLVTPAPPGSRAGNRNTATRWAGILRELGCRVAVATDWDGRPADLMVALHARKSHGALAAFRRRHPEKPAVLALTGTDLYRDIRVDASAAQSLELATRLVVLQEAALAELTASQRARARVIHQSVATRLLARASRRGLRVCVLGHLREEKDPFRAVRALRRLGEAAQVELVHAGQPLSAAMEREARRWMRAEPRYRWVGELPRWRAMQLLARSHAMIISSVLEGGAHVVSEAIALGVPVIASDIPGNRGLLGTDYPGYFPVGDEAALAALLQRAIQEPRYLSRLAAAVKRRRPLVAPTRERETWRRLLAELGIRPVRRRASGRGSRSLS